MMGNIDFLHIFVITVTNVHSVLFMFLFLVPDAS